MSSPANSKTDFKGLLDKIRRDYPDIRFEEADNFRWSAEKSTVYYTAAAEDAVWSLLHELGHMTSRHKVYNTDAMLVRMEVEAWQKAGQLAGHYGLAIDEDYIQDCIDSYRDWQYRRSTCPDCSQTGVEKAGGNYKCINCRHSWQVTPNRFCRVYRKGSAASD